MYKLVVFVGEDALEKVKEALFKAGGGRIGNYDRCCFVMEGEGQFRPLEGAKPYLGKQGKVQREREFRLETVVEDDKVRAAVEAVVAAHPYETPAYDVVKLENF